MSVYVLEFTIKGLPKMQNELLRNRWQITAGLSRLWKKRVFLNAWHLRPPVPLKTAKLTLTRHSSRRGDYDGLVSSFKAIIDGLVEAQIIENDMHENIGVPEYRWEKAGLREGFVMIRVESV